jgi:CBS domain containing-hemolysin-like protein
MKMAKSQVLFQYGILLFTLIITFSILQCPSLQQQQYYQHATVQQQQQQTNNQTSSTSISNNNTNMTTGTVPENARGPAISKDKGYLIQDLGDNLYFLTNGAYNTMFMVTDEGVIAVDAPQQLVTIT